MQEVKIKISADNKTAIQAISGTRANIDLLAHSLQALSLGLSGLKNGFGMFVDNAINLNAGLEDLQARLTGLISANSQNVLSTGEVISANEKWILSSDKARQILADLTTTARQTGIPISDMANSFSMFYATASNQGSIEKAKQAFESISYAVKVTGKDMGSLTSMFDSLATGTVLTGSEMGSFMKIIGLTNEELKEANANGKVLDLLIEKTAQFKELSEFSGGTYNNIFKSFKGEIESLTAELGKPIFETFKSGLATATAFLKENRDMILSVSGVIGSGVKHLGVFATAWITTRTAIAGFNSVLKPAIVAVGTNLTSAVGLATTASKTLNLALMTLKTAFRTFLPTALVFGALEGLISLFGSAKSASDALANSISRTTAELKKMTSAQLENQINDLQKAKADLNKERNSQIDKAYNRDIVGVLTGGAFRDETDKTKALANADTAWQQIEQIDKELKRLQNAKAGIYDETEKGSLIATIKDETEQITKSVKDQTKELNAKNRHLINYYEQQNQINEAWKIKESELRDEYANLGFDKAQIEAMVNSNKNAYLSRFDKEIKTAKVSSPKISAPKVDYTEQLSNAIAYYEAIGDLQNKEIKERELKALELQRIGLNEMQIIEYFNRLEVEAQNKKITELKQAEQEYQAGLQRAKSEMYQAGGIDLLDMSENQNKIDLIYQQQLDKLNEYYDKRLELIKQALENEQLTKDQFYELESERQALIYQRELDGQQLKNDMFISSSVNALDGLASAAKSIYDMSNGENKTALKAYQAMMIAKAIINTYTAASNAYASAGNPYLGAAMAAVAIAQGMAQVAQIKAQKFHTGGFIGDEPLKRDEVPAILQTGEFVLSRKQVAQMQNTQDNTQQNTNNSTIEPNIVIINSVDNSIMEQWANSRSGTKVIKNIIKG